MALRAVTEAGAGAGWQASQSATLQHIALLKRKRERLYEAQVDAEEQFLHSAAGDYAAGGISPAELGALYCAYVAVAADGYTRRWNSAMPISAARAKWLTREVPNGAAGSWTGTNPVNGGNLPPVGQCVVYVLFDAANNPCYVGSTRDLNNRLMNHRHDKDFARWAAYPCADRAVAYALEDRLLREYKPYLNKRAAR